MRYNYAGRTVEYLIAVFIMAAGAAPVGLAAEPSDSARGKASSSQAAPVAPDSQTAADAPHAVPDLNLSPAQKQTIYQSVLNRQSKKNAEPVGFRAAVGSHVPASIAIEELPKAVSDLVPRLKGYHFALVANQVLIVDPQSNVVIDVITQ